MRLYPAILLGFLFLVGEAVATQKHIPIPATNANVTFESLTDLEAAVAAFASDFSAARSTYGILSGEPVLQLDAGSYPNIEWDDYNLSSRITVRGSGPYSNDGYAPTAGTMVNRFLISNCSNIRLMGIVFEPSSVATTSGVRYGDSNHRIEDSEWVEVVRCAINGDIARTVADLSTEPRAGVQALVYPGGSDNCKIIQCSIMGYLETGIGLKAANPHSSANYWEVRGNVIAQGKNDGIIKLSSTTMLDWIVADNLGIGKGRASGADHRDFIQITSGPQNDPATIVSVATGWLCEGNWIQSFDAWGTDRYMAKQGFWWGADPKNTSSEAIIQDNFFGLNGAMIAGKHGGATIRFNTGFVPLDTLGSDTSDGAGVRPDTFTANYPAPSVFSGETVASADENIFPYKNGSSAHPWTGANGEAMNSTGFNQAEHSGGATFDWDVMGAFLENYDDTYSQPMAVDYNNDDTDATNGKYQVLPREGSIGKGVSPDYGVEMYKPKVGSRAHWDHTDPTGCYKLFERVFDEVDHDHWKDWGWPTAAAAHLYYDPNNTMGSSFGDYDSFDADGETVTKINVTDIGLSESSLSIYVGEFRQLSATISPSSASNQNVHWSSSDESIATVDSDGSVTAIAGGNATITVTTVDGSFTDACSVTVAAPTTYFTIQAENATISGGAVSTAQSGYTGAGFVDYPYDGSGYLEFNVSVAETGDYILSILYGNGDTGARFLTREINGSGSTSISFPPTGAWNSWSELGDEIIALAQGANTIRFTGPGAVPGGPNIDSLTIHQQWRGYRLVEGGFVNMGDVIGWLQIDFDPWVYVFSLERWMYITDAWPESGWVWLPQ